MKFYIASRWERKVDAVGVASRLVSAGHVCTARWLSEPDGDYWNVAPCMREAALRDAQDIDASEVLVVLSDPEGTAIRGGKHVETGMAMAMGKRVIVLGRRENMFHHHPLVMLAETERQLAELMQDVTYSSPGPVPPT